MSFGVDTTGFLDSFDEDQVIDNSGKKRAQDFLNSYINTAKVGGFGVDTLSTMKQKEIHGDAQQSAKQAEQGAETFGNLANFAGSLGSIGASKGGFGDFFNMGGNEVSGAGGDAVGLTMPGSKGYEFFKNGQPNFMGDYNFNFKNFPQVY